MKNFNDWSSMTALVLAILLSGLAIGMTSYYAGKMAHQYPEPEIIEIESLCYSLDPGTDGVIKLRIDEDSLYNAVFVQQGDTFALDAMTSYEFDSLVNILYSTTKP
jgi:hypothetical protein